MDRIQKSCQHEGKLMAKLIEFHCEQVRSVLTLPRIEQHGGIRGPPL
jgi:hypothetical protein